MYFDRAVTVFKKTAEGCSKQVLEGVFYDDVKGISLESKGQADAYSIKVVIPLTVLPAGFAIKEGDYICKGAVQAEYKTITDMRKAEEYYLIQTCDTKDYGQTPNILVIGR